MHAVRPLSSGLLLLGCAALVGVIALELADDVALAPDVTAAAPAALEIAEVELERFDPPPPDLFDVISERPLFVPSRRPFVPPVAPEPAVGPAEPPPEPLAAELVGVMLTESRQAVLIKHQDNPRPKRVALGQSIDGWRVEEVERGHAVLRRGDQELVLVLRPD